MLIYITSVKPFVERLNNQVEIFNEVCILLITNSLYLFTQYVPDPHVQYNCGWVVVILTLANIAVNMIVIIFKGVHEAYIKITRMIKLYKSKRKIKYKTLE